MNCDFIFYLAKKTGQCEKAIKRAISNLPITPQDTRFATNPTNLGEQLISSLKNTNIVFILGGLFSTEGSSITNVLSKALSASQPDKVYKLKNPLSVYDGYIIEKGKQVLVVLPDTPEEISAIIDETCRNYLLDFCEKF